MLQTNQKSNCLREGVGLKIDVEFHQSSSSLLGKAGIDALIDSFPSQSALRVPQPPLSAPESLRFDSGEVRGRV